MLMRVAKRLSERKLLRRLRTGRKPAEEHASVEEEASGQDDLGSSWLPADAVSTNAAAETDPQTDRGSWLAIMDEAERGPGTWTAVESRPPTSPGSWMPESPGEARPEPEHPIENGNWVTRDEREHDAFQQAAEPEPSSWLSPEPGPVAEPDTTSWLPREASEATADEAPAAPETAAEAGPVAEPQTAAETGAADRRTRALDAYCTELGLDAAAFAASSEARGAYTGDDETELLRSTRTVAANHAQVQPGHRRRWRRVLAAERDQPCGTTPSGLAARANDDLSERDRASLDDHLDACLACQGLELRWRRAERAFAAIMGIEVAAAATRVATDSADGQTLAAGEEQVAVRGPATEPEDATAWLPAAQPETAAEESSLAAEPEAGAPDFEPVIPLAEGALFAEATTHAEAESEPQAPPEPSREPTAEPFPAFDSSTAPAAADTARAADGADTSIAPAAAVSAAEADHGRRMPRVALVLLLAAVLVGAVAAVVLVAGGSTKSHPAAVARVVPTPVAKTSISPARRHAVKRTVRARKRRAVTHHATSHRASHTPAVAATSAPSTSASASQPAASTPPVASSPTPVASSAPQSSAPAPTAPAAPSVSISQSSLGATSARQGLGSGH